MPVGFFVTVSRAELNADRIETAFVGHTPWNLDGGKREIDLQGRNWRLICLEDGTSGSSTIWKEKDRPDFQASFVLMLGWCYRISTFSDSLGADDYRQMIDRFCADKPPLSDDFGGQFHCTVDPDMNPAPVTVNVKAVPPGALEAGTIGFRKGTGFEDGGAANPADAAITIRIGTIARHFQRLVHGLMVQAPKGILCIVLREIPLRASLHPHYS